jgi:hypothetical protein
MWRCVSLAAGERAGSAGVRGGAKRTFDSAQVAELAAVLGDGPSACGYARLTGVHVLPHRAGRSMQVPARRAAKRAKARVAAWPVINGGR